MGGRNPFWLALLVNQLVAWTFLAGASLVLPQTWQVKPTRGSSAVPPAGQSRSHATIVHAQATRRRRLLGRNPVVWLVARQRWQSLLVWALAGLMCYGFAEAFLKSDESQVAAWMVGGSVVCGLLYLAVATQAVRFLTDARRSGMMELILSTPLTVAQIVQGQWRAFLRQFGLPLLLCLAVLGTGTFLTEIFNTGLLQSTSTSTPAPAPAAAQPRARGGANPPPGGTTNTAGFQAAVAISRPKPRWSLPGHWTEAAGAFAVAAVQAGAALAVVAANLAALVWFGMWMGLNSKNAGLATLKTLIFVEVIPWFAISFVSGLLWVVFMGTLGKWLRINLGGAAVAIVYSLFASFLYVAKDVVFCVWTRHKLYGEFRVRASLDPGTLTRRRARALPVGPPHLTG